MTLTEQWKKGNISAGLYYIKSAGGRKSIYHVFNSTGKVYHSGAGEIKEILEPVPTYKEWQELNKRLSDTQKLDLEVRRENTELKKQIQHLSKTQAKQFIDNQKLQTKVKHAKDVVNIETARKIVKLKKLLKECRFLLGKTPYENTSQYLTFSDVMNRVDQVLQENEK